MRKNVRQLYTMAVLLGVTLCLTACGSYAMTEDAAEAETSVAYGAAADNGIYAKAAVTDAYTEEAAAEEAAPAEEMELSEETGSTAEMSEMAEQASIEKKLIKNVSLEVETQEFDVLVECITAEAEALGGYVEDFYTSGNEMHAVRNAGITLRIPAEALDGFLGKVAEKSNVLYRNESVRDVTLQYVDMDTHKKVLLTERDRLLELLEQAETVEDLIAIESRLSEVRYQIESTEAQLRAIDNQVTYSTVYINVQEVELYTPVADKSIWDEIAEGFGNNVYRVFDGIEDCIVAFIIGLPFLLVWIVVIVVIVLLIKLFGKLCRIRMRKRTKRQAEKQSREMDYEVIPVAETKQKEVEQNTSQEEDK